MNKKIMSIAVSALLLAASVSCSQKNDSSVSGTTEYSEASVSTESGTDEPLPIEDNTVEPPDNVKKTVKKYEQLDIVLPDTITEKPFTEIELDPQEIEGLLALTGDFVVGIAAEKDQSDQSDIHISKYSISSQEKTEITGGVPTFHVSSGVYAVCGDKVNMIYNSFTDRLFCCIDLEKNRSDIFRDEEWNYGQDSLYFTYPVSEDEYAVYWFNFDENNHNLIHKHVAVCNSANEIEEVFSGDYDVSREGCFCAVADKKIYELIYEFEPKVFSLNTYDLSGKLLQSEVLAPITEDVRSSRSTEIRNFDVSGSYVSVSVTGNEEIAETTYIFDLEKETYMKFNAERFRVVPNNTLNKTDDLVFFRDVSRSDGTNREIYVFDNDTNSVYKLADVKERLSNIITDGRKVAYIQNNKIIVSDIA